MAFEADRMQRLVLSDDVVGPERDVVIEERRMRTDTDPGAQLGEAVAATLFTQHPYGKPIIGWMHEIEGLTARTRWPTTAASIRPPMRSSSWPAT